jgi:hypothetical protein
MPDLTELAVAHVTADVALVTVAETAIITSETIFVTSPEARVLVLAVAQLTTGAATTTVTPRIRRGADATGTLVGDAVPITIGAAAGSTEQYVHGVIDTLDNVDQVQYTYTLQQASASGNGSALQAAIVALLL